MKKALLLGTMVLTCGAGAALAQGHDTSMYPAASAGMVQHVFTLPAQEDEQAYRVEIVAGQTVMADCNNTRFSADLDEEDVAGWGYSYYEIDDISPMMSTMMACGDSARTEKFIEAGMGDEAMVRYNSKLPLVIYAPTELKVGYRIWHTDGTVEGIDAN